MALVPQAVQVMEEPAVGTAGPYQLHRHTAAAGRGGQGWRATTAASAPVQRGRSVTGAAAEFSPQAVTSVASTTLVVAWLPQRTHVGEGVAAAYQ